MSLLLKNAFVVDLNSSYHHTHCDIFLEKGIIKSFSKSKASKEIDLKGMVVTPGWFDLNAHFCEPGFEFKEELATGAQTAISGGFTDVALIPNTQPPIDNKGLVSFLKNKAPKEIDIHILGAASQQLMGESLTEMWDLKNAGVIGFTDGNLPIWNTNLLLRALQYTQPMNVPIIQYPTEKYLAKDAQMHEGEISTRLGLTGEPSLSEVIMLRRDIEILKYSGGSLHFSRISTGDSVKIIKEAKELGLNVTCDVSIHHLMFSDESNTSFDTNFKVSPPYRTERDRKELIKGVKNGTINAICSNHRPQDIDSKNVEFNLAEVGNIALQTFPSCITALSAEIPLEILISCVTHRARQIVNMDSHSIEEGVEAKLTILDPKATWTLNEESNLAKSTNSPFWKKELKGIVFGTINGNYTSFQKR